MGAGWYRSARDPPVLPDTELTPCAILLYRMGYRVVVLSFEHAVVTMTKEVMVNTRRGYFVVNPYLEERRQELERTLATHISNDVCTLIVSLLAQGILVVVSTEADDRRNGDVVKASASNNNNSSSGGGDNLLISSSSAGYQYDGRELIGKVLVERLGPDLGTQVHVDTLSAVFAYKHPSTVLVVSPCASTVKKARKRRMGAIHVSEYFSTVH